MRAHHLLEANNVGADAAYRVAEFGQNEASVKRRKAFMGVNCQHVY